MSESSRYNICEFDVMYGALCFYIFRSCEEAYLGLRFYDELDSYDDYDKTFEADLELEHDFAILFSSIF